MPGVSSITRILPVRVENELYEQLEALLSRFPDSSRNTLAKEALRRGLDQMEAELAEPQRPRRGRKKKPQLQAVGLEAFAAQVLEAARNSPDGRFGEDRVFVSHVWAQYQREHPDSDLGEAAFKQRLLEANRARHLSLVCADMAPILDQADVQASEIRYLTARFHFVCI